MNRPGLRQIGIAEARKRFPELLTAAENGESTIITKCGQPMAVLVPISAYAAERQQPLSPLAGSGSGLWGLNSRDTLRKMRDDWRR